MRWFWILGLMACLGCGREGIDARSPEGEAIPEQEVIFLFQEQSTQGEGRDWYLCTAPGYMPCLVLDGSPGSVTTMMPKPSEDGALREGAAFWFELRNPSGLPFTVDLNPDPVEPLSPFLHLRLSESLSVHLPHIFALLEPKDLARAARGAMGQSKHGGLLWLGRRSIVGLGGRGLLPPTATHWASDYPLVWIPSQAPPDGYPLQSSGLIPGPAEFVDCPWVVCRAVPGSVLCLNEEGSAGQFVLAGPSDCQQEELVGKGAYFGESQPGPGQWALLGDGDDGSVSVEVRQGVQVEAGRVTWLGDMGDPQGADSLLTIQVDLELRGEAAHEEFQLSLSTPGGGRGNQAPLELILPLKLDAPLRVRGLPAGLWRAAIVPPPGWLLEGAGVQSVQLESEAACHLQAWASPGAPLQLRLASNWRSRGPYLLTLLDGGGRRDMTLDLRQAGGVLWNSAHLVPTGEYLCWFRPRTKQATGQDLAYGIVEVDADGLLHLTPEPGLVLLENAVPGEGGGPRGKTLHLADQNGLALDPTLVIVPQRRGDGKAATGLLSSSMIVLDAISGQRVFDRGVPGKGYSVE